MKIEKLVTVFFCSIVFCLPFSVKADYSLAPSCSFTSSYFTVVSHADFKPGVPVGTDYSHVTLSNGLTYTIDFTPMGTGGNGCESFGLTTIWQVPEENPDVWIAGPNPYLDVCGDCSPPPACIGAGKSISADGKTCITASTCGTANGQSFSSPPLTNLCSTKSGVMYLGNGAGDPWKWGCIDKNDHNSYSSCSATLYTGTGKCGPLNGMIFGSYSEWHTYIQGKFDPDFCLAGALLPGDGSVSGAIESWLCGTTPCASYYPPSSTSTVTCGSSNGVTFSTKPIKDLCSDGSAAIGPFNGSSGAYWWWLCSAGPVCKANKAVTPLVGSCGPANSTPSIDVPIGTTNLCSNSTTTISTVSGTGPWNWSCDGTACSANKKYSCATGCSKLFYGIRIDSPYESLDSDCLTSLGSAGIGYTLDCACHDGVVSMPSYDYSSCIVSVPVIGSCGSDHTSAFTPPAAPTNHCSPESSFSGTYTNAATLANDATWQWKCLGAFGGASADCWATKNNPIAGVCGSANGTPALTAPTDPMQLCSSGSVDVTPSGSGPWSWKCKGSFGGGDSPACSASIKPQISIQKWQESSL
ncbi:MAG: hypothetical protein WCI36_03575 [bacterium]